MASTAKPLPPKVVAYLLDKLGNDDTFRNLFVTDLVEALTQAGAPEPEDCARCMKVPKLADKKVIRDTNEALRNQLTGNLNLHIPLLIAK